MNDFGYDKYDGEPYVRLDGKWYGGDGLRAYDEWVTPVQVVGPGQVAVDANLIRRAARHAEEAADNGFGGDALAELLRAALAAAEPPPKFNKGGKLNGPIPFEPDNGYIIPKRTRAAAPDSDQGEMVADGDFDADGNRIRCQVCGDPYDINTDAWGVCGKDSCWFANSTPAAEPDRVTLPDTPHTKVRVVLVDGERVTWESIDGGDWYCEAWDEDVENETLARVVDYTVLAEPPKADPAETDAPHGPTLAAVARALVEKAHEFEYADRRSKAAEYRSLASYIEREAGRPSDVTDGRTDDLTSSRLGGDGHE